MVCRWVNVAGTTSSLPTFPPLSRGERDVRVNSVEIKCRKKKQQQRRRTAYTNSETYSLMFIKFNLSSSLICDFSTWKSKILNVPTSISILNENAVQPLTHSHAWSHFCDVAKRKLYRNIENRKSFPDKFSYVLFMSVFFLFINCLCFSSLLPLLWAGGRARVVCRQNLNLIYFHLRWHRKYNANSNSRIKQHTTDFIFSIVRK